MDKKNAIAFRNHMNAKNNGYRYFLVKSGKCADCWDVAKEKIEPEKPSKKGKGKDADNEANNGTAE